MLIFNFSIGIINLLILWKKIKGFWNGESANRN